MAALPTTTHDLIIIGGGIAGRFCAWNATNRGLRTLLLDPDDARASAAWASGGMLAPVAEGLTGGLLEIGLAARAAWPDAIRRLQQQSATPLTLDHGIVVPLAPETSRAPMAGYLGQMRARADIVMLGDEPDALPAQAGFERAALVRDEFVVAPRAVLAALAQATADSVEVVRDKAEQIRVVSGAVHVEGTAAAYTGRSVVVCAGHRAGLIRGLEPFLPGTVTGERGALLYVRSDNRPPWTIFDHGLTGVTYLVPTDDGYRIGATADPEDRCRTVRPEEIDLLLSRAASLWHDPGAEVVEAVAGARPVGPLTTGEPLVGPLDPDRRIWGLLGMHRNGILFSPFLADKLIEKVAVCLSS